MPPQSRSACRAHCGRSRPRVAPGRCACAASARCCSHSSPSRCRPAIPDWPSSSRIAQRTVKDGGSGRQSVARLGERLQPRIIVPGLCPRESGRTPTWTTPDLVPVAGVSALPHRAELAFQVCQQVVGVFVAWSLTPHVVCRPPEHACQLDSSKPQRFPLGLPVYKRVHFSSPNSTSLHGYDLGLPRRPCNAPVLCRCSAIGDHRVGS